MMAMKILKTLVLCSLLVTIGCVNTRAKQDKSAKKNNLLFTDTDIADIFKTYGKEALKARQKRKLQSDARIQQLDVFRTKGDEDFVVSAHLNNAPLKTVINVILNKTHTQYFLRDVVLMGFVSGRFEKLPLLRALNILLNSQGYSAKFSEEGVLFIQDGVPKKVSKKEEKKNLPGMSPEPGRASPTQFSGQVQRTSLTVQIPPPGMPGEPDMPPPGMPGEPDMPPPGMPGESGQSNPPYDPMVMVEYPLQYLSVASAGKVLTSLFGGEGGADAGGGEPPGTGSAGSVQYGFEETRNTVIIKGNNSKVKELKRVLQTIDREPQHVLIEVLVMEVDADALEELNFALRDYANKKYSGLASNVGAEDANALLFTFENLRKGETGFTSNIKFSGLVDLLHRKDLARIIARPYLASITGKESNLRITEDRSIIVSQVAEGASVSSTKEISSGVELSITPTVHLSGVINMKVDVEQSDFLSSSGNVAASKDTNKASTVMQVPTGQSIIIGGLMFNSRSSSNAGLPWLRHVPLLNVFSAAQKRTEVDKEVLIVVTPHLYSPGLRTPLPFLEVFQKPTNHKILKTTPTERGDMKQY